MFSVYFLNKKVIATTKIFLLTETILYLRNKESFFVNNEVIEYGQDNQIQ